MEEIDTQPASAERQQEQQPVDRVRDSRLRSTRGRRVSANGADPTMETGPHATRRLKDPPRQDLMREVGAIEPGVFVCENEFPRQRDRDREQEKDGQSIH